MERVQAGDVVMVRTGEVIPVDGTLESDKAVIDTSTLTGEPLPVRVTVGMSVLSGTSNAGAPFDVKAQRTASDSACPRSYGWWSRRRQIARRLSGWPTGMRDFSSRSRS